MATYPCIILGFISKVRNQTPRLKRYCCAMFSTETMIALTAFAFVSSITPGPNNLMLMSSGANFGFVRSLPHMLGVAIGFVLMLLVVGGGLGAIVRAFPPVLLVMKFLSMGYLLYLAWRTATAAAPNTEAAPSSARPLSFLQAAAFQWVNPKAWTMALTAMAVYVPADNRTTGVLVVALVIGTINLPSISIWTALGVQLRRLFHRPRALRAFNIASALLLVASLYPVLTAGFAQV
jgi:threonine/homoserine/homoserine lactone efflux protein